MRPSVGRVCPIAASVRGGGARSMTSVAQVSTSASRPPRSWMSLSSAATSSTCGASAASSARRSASRVATRATSWKRLATSGEHVGDDGRRRRPRRRARRARAAATRAGRSVSTAAAASRLALVAAPRDVNARGSTRLAIDARRGRSRARRSSRARKPASWAGAVSSVVTTTNVVRGSPSSASTSRARATKPFSIAWKSTKKSAMSCRNREPSTRSATW